MNATRPYWWLVNIGSGNGLVPSGHNDGITHPRHNFNGGLAKPPLKLRHGWVITYHTHHRMCLRIHALISVDLRKQSGPLEITWTLPILCGSVCAVLRSPLIYFYARTYPWFNDIHVRVHVSPNWRLYHSFSFQGKPLLIPLRKFERTSVYSAMKISMSKEEKKKLVSSCMCSNRSHQ